jgi:hypothetical protein
MLFALGTRKRLQVRHGPQIFVWSVERFELLLRYLTQKKGNLGTTKTLLGEISDHTNQITLFTLWTITEGIAGILGALIGGYLCRPASTLFFPAHSLICLL